MTEASLGHLAQINIDEIYFQYKLCFLLHSHEIKINLCIIIPAKNETWLLIVQLCILYVSI